MALEITPNKKLDNVVLGEELQYALDCTAELGDNTVDVHTYEILDADDADVTATMSGGSVELDGIINFGLKCAALGTYKLKFVVTCVETLPDAVTPYEFYVRLNVTVKPF